MRVFLPIVLTGLVLLLSSCADTEWPHWLSGEPSRAELDAYHGPIEMPKPDTDGKDWPNLADVPARPAVLMSDSDKQKLVSEMTAGNSEGNKEIAALNEKLHPAQPTKKSVTKKQKKKLKKKVKQNETE